MNWTTIEWTDLTSNPIRGTAGNWHCEKVSIGCRNCYAETINQRWGGPAYQRRADTLRLDEKELSRILNVRRISKKPVKGKSVFLCDMTDLFQFDVKPEWIAAIAKVIRLRPDLIFQVLTKRPENIRPLKQGLSPWPSNLHLGVTVECSDPLVLSRLRYLSGLKDDFNIPVVFLSCEPLLSPLDLRAALHWLDWVIVGGESGPKASPLHPHIVETIRDHCASRQVPFFFKQWGEWQPVGSLYSARLHPGDSIIKRDGSPWTQTDRGDDPWIMRRTGKKHSGALLNGREYRALPPVQFSI